MIFKQIPKTHGEHGCVPRAFEALGISIPDWLKPTVERITSQRGLYEHEVFVLMDLMHYKRLRPRTSIFDNTFKEPYTTYFCQTDNHFFAVKDGIYYDIAHRPNQVVQYIFIKDERG